MQAAPATAPISKPAEHLPLIEIVLVLVRLAHVASRIVDANHSIL
jgi:hypothetical protein